MIHPNSSRRLQTSLRIIQIIILAVFLLFLGRLVQLTVFEFDTYNPISERNSIRQETVNPSRGLIFDRNGVLLVENTPVFSIHVTPIDFNADNVPLLAYLMNIPEESVTNALQRARNFSWYRSSRMFSEVEFDVFSRIEENIWRLPGISHQIESKRVYPAGIRAAHVLGYLREVSDADFRSTNIYRLGDKAGRTGIERTYESYLRGETGAQLRRVNAFGQGIGPYSDGMMDRSPVRGANLQTTLDAELQRLAEKLMEGKVGSLVALDPNNGEVLALVSAPDFEISRLSGRVDRTYLSSVISDSTRPMFNRAIATRQPPGSTFKPMMGLVGLHTGLVTPQTTVFCNGGYVRGRLYRCTAIHGNQNLEEAIMNSCNTYFFHMMNRFANTIGLNEWHRYMQTMGLGRLNGIDIPSEQRGILPDSTQMDQIFGRGRWGLGDQINLGVGQGVVSATPLQMAIATAEIANGGYWVQPHVVRAIHHEYGEIEYANPTKTRVEWIQEKDLEPVRVGMRRAVTEGSGRFFANLQSVPTAGKTGTAQNPHGRDHGWFIAYAPYDDPQIAIAVIIENGGFGSVSAAPIASLLIEQYMNGEVRRQNLLRDMLNFVPRESTIQR
ncbi:MAG: penicillin-binding protein 2 [Bacteroidetes bacterium]|nr:penicillin-binding protein 2 [Bacteroidota bacterium]MCH8523691.1 penicillin-binding protein 2 [Balneolales bacterium]